MSPEDSFTTHKPLLFSIAYRMLGSVMDAEDIVQETFLRWKAAAPAQEIDSPKAYLASIATRLSIDRLRLAQTQREVYVGEWLPEPLFDPPGDVVEMDDSLSVAFLTVLESLTPIERAVLLLRDVFDFDYPEIARFIDKSEVNCRQALSRARKAIAERRPRFEVDAEQHQQLLARFAQATVEGDMDGLLAILSDDVVSYSDGGGKASSATRIVRGPERVAKLMIGITRRPPPFGLVGRVERVNHYPAIVLYYPDGRRYSVLQIDTDGNRIRGIYNVLNPDKINRAENKTP